MVAIQTQVATFSKKRSRAYVPNLANCRGFWRFGKDAENSTRNLVPGALQPGAIVGAPVYGDNFIQFDSTADGINTGIIGGAEPFTMALMCTRPVITAGAGVDSNGIYVGFHNGLGAQQACIQYVPAGINGVIDFVNVAEPAVAYNQGQSFAMLFLTNDGDDGLFGYANQSGVAAATYARDADAGTFPFRVGLGQKNSGAGNNPHSMKVHSAALYDTALDAAAIGDLYATLATWATDVGLTAA